MAVVVELGYDETGTDVYLDFAGFENLYTRNPIGVLEFYGLAASFNEQSHVLGSLELVGDASSITSVSNSIGNLEFIGDLASSPTGIIALGTLEAQGLAVGEANITTTFANAVEFVGAAQISNGVSNTLGTLELRGEIDLQQLAIIAPLLLWQGCSSDGTNISIPISQLPGLTTEAADSTIGDWRKILRAILLSAREYESVFAPGTGYQAYHTWVTLSAQNHPTLDNVARHRFYTRIYLADVDTNTLEDEP